MIKIEIIIEEKNKFNFISKCEIIAKPKRKLATENEKLIENKIYENFNKIEKESIEELIKSL